MKMNRLPDVNKELVDAYFQTPAKNWFYQNAYNKMMMTGVFRFRWVWSWWAFFGTYLYLLYRKSYLAAIVLFLAYIPIGLMSDSVQVEIAILSFAYLFLVMLIPGGCSTYFVLKRFHDLIYQIESKPRDEQLMIVRDYGGKNTWVVWVFSIWVISILFIIGFLVFQELY
jgi:hypothetical protein